MKGSLYWFNSHKRHKESVPPRTVTFLLFFRKLSTSSCVVCSIHVYPLHPHTQTIIDGTASLARFNNNNKKSLCRVAWPRLERGQHLRATTSLTVLAAWEWKGESRSHFSAGRTDRFNETQTGQEHAWLLVLIAIHHGSCLSFSSHHNNSEHSLCSQLVFVRVRLRGVQCRNMRSKF